MEQAKQNLSFSSALSILDLQKLSIGRCDEPKAAHFRCSSANAIMGQSSPTSVLDRILFRDNFTGGWSVRKLPRVTQAQPIATMDDEDFEMELMEANNPILPRFLCDANRHSQVACHRPRDPVAGVLLCQC